LVLPNEHWGLVIYSKGLKTLDHARVRIAYEYCALCGKTVKDYGGKKHLYDSYGTLMSDVWKDTAVDAPDSPPAEVLRRVRDMFSVGDNRRMLILPLGDGSSLGDLRLPQTNLSSPLPPILPARIKRGNVPIGMLMPSRLIRGDALEILPSFPDASVDLAFADPPYNLAKGYRGYSDHMDVDRYFGWCDAWLEHLCRVLKPAGSLVVVNTPQGAMRHFLYVQQRLTFMNWIAWDSMSMPVRHIMPSHYPLLVFT
jgi:site-specific DNA-methyltransferase (adenine-specific)